MALTRWDPFREVMPLRQMMDRLMEDAFIQPGRMLGGTEGMGVAIDLIEREDELLVKASLPGVKPEDVDISIQDNVLTIQGEMREEYEQPQSQPPGQERPQGNGQRGEQQAQGGRRPQYHYRERLYGRFMRQLSLPTAVNADRAEAAFENGVLTIMLPKAEEAKRRRIQVGGRAGRPMIEGQAQETTAQTQTARGQPGQR